MNPLPACSDACTRARLRLSGALAFGRHALACRAHRWAPAASIGPLRLLRRVRTLGACARRAPELRAATPDTTSQARP
ncbi:hypothetical protein VC279_12295 [Xanthomonas sp. WHRI 10064A]|uniref:hypothetical protein n=1 Tax=unclassified Xanthomonas TaxID=2643310 RepID=UPI002B23D34D|nr:MULTISPECIES: hypothetical protein [unclassified Xanthomonas]MEA9587742.1 hypothetical protein [Xanthomonas sp. WHRI 10064B]MEA9615464.1 hypothetical protein [Xanthomonas sp. WHRI 10064A]